ncbi:hypothetical protein D3C80_1593120 [compost metagenome]
MQAMCNSNPFFIGKSKKYVGKEIKKIIFYGDNYQLRDVKRFWLYSLITSSMSLYLNSLFVIFSTSSVSSETNCGITSLKFD